jgi:hypothetical protein
MLGFKMVWCIKVISLESPRLTHNLQIAGLSVRPNNTLFVFTHLQQAGMNHLCMQGVSLRMMKADVGCY